VARPAGLGRGIEAILGARTTAIPEGSTLEAVPVGSIEPNPNQPRVHFDEESIAELSESIAELGVLQPIRVRRLGGGRFQLVAGERRWRAATRAGLTHIPAVVCDVTDLVSAEQALVENLHREDLTALEEASGYQHLIEDFAYTHEQLAKRMGKSRAAISNSLRLLQLPPAIQQLLADGLLSAGHARALLGTSDRQFQDHLARRAASEGWSVRAVEEAVRDRERGGTSPQPVDKPSGNPRGTRLRSPAVLEVESQLADHLSTAVTVSLGGKRGKIVIEFADLDDLDRLFRQLLGPDSGDDQH